MNMTMKTLLKSIGLGLLLSTTSVFAQQSATPIYSDVPLVNGWNLWLTNGQVLGPGVTNQIFTQNNGQIVFSGANPVINGVINTNVVAADAFSLNGVAVVPDVNGDVAANAAIHVVMNQTNWIPVAVTNAAGQYFVYQGTTNGLPSQTFPSAGWPLITATGPIWMFPASTNIYTILPSANSTNNITFNFQRGWRYNTGNNNYVYVWDTTTNVFQFTYNGAIAPNAGAGQQTIVTNLPTTFTQGAQLIRCAGITVTSGGPMGAYVINQISVGQPRP